MCGDLPSYDVLGEVDTTQPAALQEARTTVESTRQQLLITTEGRRALLVQIVSLLRRIREATDDSTTPAPSACHAILALLARLIGDYQLAVEFQSLGGIALTFGLNASQRFTGSQHLLSLIVRRCVEDPQTLQDSMERTIHESFLDGKSKRANNSPGPNRIALPVFINMMTDLYSRNPLIFLSAASRICTFRSLNGTVYVFPRTDAPRAEKRASIPENWHVLVDLAEVIARAADATSSGFIDTADALQTLKDVVVSAKGSEEYIASFKITSRATIISEVSDSPTFVACLLDIASHWAVTSPDAGRDATATGSNESQAAVRLLLALASRPSESRKLVIAELMNKLRALASQPINTTAKLSAIRAACSFLIVLTTSDHRAAAGPATTSRRLCLDVIRQLASHGVADILTSCLAQIDLDQEDAVVTVRAILEPVELLSRPSLIHCIPKHKKVTQTHKTDDAQRNQLPDSEHELAYYDAGVFPEGLQDQRPLPDAEREGIPHESAHDADQEEDDEEEEEEGEGEEEEEGEEDEDDEEDEDEDEGEGENEEEEDEEEEVQEEIEEGEDEAPGPEQELLDEPWETVPDLEDTINELVRHGGQPIADIGLSRRGARLLQPEDFITPPNQIRVDPFGQMLSNLALGNVEVDEDMGAPSDVLNMLRRSGIDLRHSNVRRFREQDGQMILELEARVMPHGGAQPPFSTRQILSEGAPSVRYVDSGPIHPLVSRTHPNAPSRATRADMLDEFGDATSFDRLGEINELEQALSGQAAHFARQFAFNTAPRPAMHVQGIPTADITSSTSIALAPLMQRIFAEQLLQADLAEDESKLPESAESTNTEAAIKASAEERNAPAEETKREEPEAPTVVLDEQPPAAVGDFTIAQPSSSVTDLVATVTADMPQEHSLEAAPTVDTTAGEPQITVSEGEVAAVVEDERLESQLVCPPDYDPEVFAALPDFMQREIVEQYQQTRDQTMELAVAAGLDPEALAALPESIRQEIIEQARRDQQRVQEPPADPTRAAEMDNASFLASLTPELRAEVLLQSDPAFLASLPPDMVAEAQVLRERVASRWQENPYEMHAPVEEPRLHAESDESPQAEIATQRVIQQPKQIPGKMMVEPEDPELKALPPRFIPTALTLAYQRRGGWGTHLLERTFSHIAKNPLMRTVLLDVILALLQPGQQASARTILTEAFALDTLRMPFPPRRLFGPQTPDGIKQTTRSDDLEALQYTSPEKVVRLMLGVLSFLASNSARMRYFMLSNEAGASSYFERLVGLLQYEQFKKAATQLDAVMRLLDTVSSPLDNIPRGTDASNTASAANATENKEEAELVEEKSEPASQLEVVHKADANSWVDIPQPQLSDENLRILCGPLLLETCSEESFRQISRIVSRLTYSARNVVPIISHLRVVAEGLSEAISMRLLDCVKQLTGLPRQASSFRHKSNTQSLGNETTESKDTEISDFSARVQSILPLLPFQPQQYERFYRTLQLLLSLSEKTDGYVWEVLSSLNIQDLWDALDIVLDKVRTVSGLEEEEVSTAQPTKNVTSTSSAVTVVLLRLLPLIESFCLLMGRQAAVIQTKRQVMQQAAPTEETLGEAIPFTRADSLPGAKFRRVTSLRSSIHENEEINENDYLTRLIAFAQAHHTLLNSLIRASPELLEGSLQTLVDTPQCRVHLAFDNKRAYFRSQLRKLKGNRSLRRTLHLSVRRSHIFADSFHQLRMRSGAELRQRLAVTFHGEEGIDVGGLTREWFTVLSREIFNPNYALFTAANDGATFQPNPLSYVNPDHLDYFRFVGRVIGKAIHDEQLMDAHFTISFYKHLLGLPITHHDMEAVDPEYYKNLKQILEYPLDDLGLDLTFSAEDSRFGKLETIDLIPDGRNVRVTDENKFEYVRLITCHRMTTAIRQQIEAFLEGFHELVPPQLISVFTPAELELLICGLPDIDIEDLRLNSEYHQYQQSDDQIVWFWDALRSFSREEKAQFLQFVTGTSKVPLDGFANLRGMRGPQRFSIHRVYDAHMLPTAHTCFNQLDLPAYETQEELREKLLLAIREGHTGFGFA